MNLHRTFITTFLLLAVALGAMAQARYTSHARMSAEDTIPAAAPDTVPQISVSDSLLDAHSYEIDIFDMPMTLPEVFFLPPIYDKHTFYKPLALDEQVHSGNPALRWVEDYDVLNRRMIGLRQHLFVEHPELVKYSLSMLPEAPKQFTVVVDPSDYSIDTREIIVEPTAPTIAPEEVKKRHWIRTFSASLQFSQAYVSPNWYQGGNNNLNALGQLYYNVKLNEAFHPNLLFETTAQYKLGLNNAPDDSIHAYNISEDVFQVNTTFGVKAAHRWYYSFTGQFKTQLLNNYKSNTRDLKASFLSPGELTAGVGMTYSYENKPKTFNFNASLAPISYNLKTCISDRIDHSIYNISPERETKHSFGSTAEFKLAWKISYNISFNSRLFVFSDYDSFQADWENTLAFEINRFLTTQIYCHARYDSKTAYDPDGEWRKLQIKEIFSIGFAYKFATI